jgi:osmotically-inducible protein OsmY
LHKVYNSRAIASLSGSGVKISTPGRLSRLRADSDVPAGSWFAAETYGIQVASQPAGVTQMMKEHFGKSVCRTAAILSALLCWQEEATLLAQQPVLSVTAEPNTASAPNQTQALGAVQRRDQNLRREIQQQFATDPAFQSIKVNVSKGVVVLEGPVASKRDRWRAVNSVKVLPHVTSVDDRLTISARTVKGATASTYATSAATLDSTMSKAAEVANEITVAVADNPSLAKSRVNVTVSGDSIELTGTVTSKEQREKVREIANAFAVHSHVVDKLTIAPGDNRMDSK